MREGKPTPTEIALAKLFARFRREEIAPLRERLVELERSLGQTREDAEAVVSQWRRTAELGEWRPEHSSWRTKQ